MCCNQGQVCKLFINVTTFHIEAKGRVKTIENEYFVAYDGFNWNQKINTRER